MLRQYINWPLIWHDMTRYAERGELRTLFRWRMIGILPLALFNPYTLSGEGYWYVRLLLGVAVLWAVAIVLFRAERYFGPRVLLHTDPNGFENGVCAFGSGRAMWAWLATTQFAATAYNLVFVVPLLVVACLVQYGSVAAAAIVFALLVCFAAIHLSGTLLFSVLFNRLDYATTAALVLDLLAVFVCASTASGPVALSSPDEWGAALPRAVAVAALAAFLSCLLTGSLLRHRLHKSAGRRLRVRSRRRKLGLTNRQIAARLFNRGLWQSALGSIVLCLGLTVIGLLPLVGWLVIIAIVSSMVVNMYIGALRSRAWDDVMLTSLDDRELARMFTVTLIRRSFLGFPGFVVSFVIINLLWGGARGAPWPPSVEFLIPHFLGVFLAIFMAAFVSLYAALVGVDAVTNDWNAKRIRDGSFSLRTAGWLLLPISVVAILLFLVLMDTAFKTTNPGLLAAEFLLIYGAAFAVAGVDAWSSWGRIVDNLSNRLAGDPISPEEWAVLERPWHKGHQKERAAS